jgi:uncharacterized protein YcbK (DUF882 family)
MIKKYSLKKDGEKQLSKNFKVKEFACNDGSDTILIDTKLVEILQMIRDRYKLSVKITSGYRTKSYNATIEKSSKASKHCEGMAADIQIKGIAPLQIAKYCESKGVKGIGLYNTFTHVDSRKERSFWMLRANSLKPVVSFLKM